MALTPLPDGGYAEYAWGSLSEIMRQKLVDAAARRGREVTAHPSTLLALMQRGLVEVVVGETSNRYFVTRRGLVLVEWAKEKDRV